MTGTVRKIVNQARRRPLVWRYGFNLTAVAKHLALQRHPLTGSARAVPEGLRKRGVAKLHVENLFSDPSVFEGLQRDTTSLISSKKHEIGRSRASAKSSAVIGAKTFNIELLGSSLVFDPDCPFAGFALQEPFVGIANAYFGMTSKLRYYNVWNTFASESEARESQLWHRDREDLAILKMFVYLNDVGEGNGPFTYAPGTHSFGEHRSAEPEFALEDNVRRSTDEQMAAVVPSENWVRATGKKGTIVFADTSGYHKGGEARTGDRLMFTCMYTSPASDSKRLIEYPAGFDRSKLSETQLRAL